MSVKRVEINEKVGVSADFVIILEQCEINVKKQTSETSFRFSLNARTFHTRLLYVLL